MVAHAAAILANCARDLLHEGAMPTPDSTPPLVLIASDQEWSGRSLETIIGPRGYAVVRAHTGQQVLETVRTNQVDLLILDTRLPDVDGIQLCRRLRDQRIVPATTPIILTTSVQTTRASSIAAFAAGAWDFCTHPVDSDLLLSKMENFVRAKRAADRAQEESLLDESTGLYNFRGMARRARETGAEALRVRGAMACVALAPVIDDDAVEDGESLETLAKGVGEHLGMALARTARASDVIGHLGRAEFAVIAPATTPEGAERLMERLQRALESTMVPVGGGPRAFRVRGSFFAVPDYSDSSIHVLEMLERASSSLHAQHGLADYPTTEYAHAPNA
jgi:PleD family two-component response regulator